MSDRIMLLLSVVAVSAAAIAGLMALGSPASQRERRFDERRVDDLTSLATAIDVYRTAHDRLPDALADLADTAGANRRLRDPLTLTPYEYHLLDGRRYELCATFQHQAEQWPEQWSHRSGRQCFPMSVRD